MASKAKMAKALDEAGWRAERRRGEPTWYFDPYGFETKPLRVEEAFGLQEKRERSVGELTRRIREQQKGPMPTIREIADTLFGKYGKR